MQNIKLPAKMALLISFACVLACPSLATQSLNLDIGLLAWIPGKELKGAYVIAHRNLSLEKNNFYITQHQIGSLLLDANDSWQIGIAYNLNYKLGNLKIYPGIALSKTFPPENMSISPLLYFKNPASLNFWGRWNFHAELYPFTDGAALWYSFVDEVNFLKLKVRIPLGGFINLRYRNLEFSNHFNIGIGLTREF